MEMLNDLYEAVLKGNLPKAIEATNQAIAANVKPQIIINDYMAKAMGEIGAQFEAGKAFVPNMLLAARAMKGALEILRPLISKEDDVSIGTVLIGTVKGDLHDIGKNLVAFMLEGCGFNVINLGVDISPEKFVAAIKEHQPQIICLSALLTTTMNNMKDVIVALKQAGLKDKVKVMVGGAPVNADFAREIGADGYSENANSAVGMAKNLLSIAS
jgi:corrinoid protein of di/trimethylamine methyltransferase